MKEPKRNKRGRKPLQGKRLWVRVPESLHAAIDRSARSQGVTMSDLARSILAEAMVPREKGVAA